MVVSTFSAPVEGVITQTPGTKLLIEDQELGTATLYITENNVVWGGGVRPSGLAAPTISLLYPSISIHAIQREPSPALYVVLNYELKMPELNQSGGGDNKGEDVDDDFDPEDQPITQLRFIPENENELQNMYSAMCQGQALHPDPADEADDDDYMDGEEFDEGEIGDEEFEDAEESNSTPEDAAARLRQMRLDNSNGDANHYHDAQDQIEE